MKLDEIRSQARKGTLGIRERFSMSKPRRSTPRPPGHRGICPCGRAGEGIFRLVRRTSDWFVRGAWKVKDGDTVCLCEECMRMLQNKGGFSMVDPKDGAAIDLSLIGHRKRWRYP